MQALASAVKALTSFNKALPLASTNKHQQGAVQAFQALARHDKAQTSISKALASISKALARH